MKENSQILVREKSSLKHGRSFHRSGWRFPNSLRCAKRPFGSLQDECQPILYWSSRMQWHLSSIQVGSKHIFQLDVCDCPSHIGINSKTIRTATGLIPLLPVQVTRGINSSCNKSPPTLVGMNTMSTRKSRNQTIPWHALV